MNNHQNQKRVNYLQPNGRFTFEYACTLSLVQAEAAKRDGLMNDEEFSEYCWLWRNCAVRFGRLYQHLEGKPAPSERAAKVLQGFLALKGGQK